MPPPEGHDSATPLLYRSSPPPTIPLYSYNPPDANPLRPSLPRVCFSACPSRTKIGPVKNNEVAPV